MKKFTAITAIIVLALGIAIPALAADKILSFKVDGVTEFVSRSGNQCARITFQENKSLQGIAYTTQSTVLAFGDKLDAARQIKPGQQVKMIVSDNGKGYALIHVVEAH